ncbi:amidase [Sinorhizobium saheli]|uniref:Amidase n=2 Tax=Sinorhizobium saheli TaxID=36856 RepID=A0A178YUJ2_SINSA|nr:amidase [Sinorhizobium saheli]OAP50415.1 amidase [Sinorhizobium saheli]
MDSETIGYMTAIELVKLIRTRKISPVEYMRALLDRIEALEPKLNVFAHLAADKALDDAKRAEADLMSGKRNLGRLHGVPVTIKDLQITKDMPTQQGSKIYAGHQPSEDAPLVTRLREQGAIVLGKTTVSEIGWTGVSRSPLTGITSNPWKLGYNAGASSAGAGTAAAAGLGPLHQGSDGGGSIRLPAHCCGIFGHKPSFGRVPNYPVSAGDMTSHVGPMSRTVADSALMLEVMAGPHFLDYSSLEAGPANYLARLEEGVRGKRIAYSPDLGFARVDPEVAELVKASAGRFEELGAKVHEVSTAWADEGPEIFRFFWSASCSGLAGLLSEWESEMDPGLVACIKQAEDVPVSRFEAMRRRKMDYVANIHRWFQDWDLLLTPAAAVAAFPVEPLVPGQIPVDPWEEFNWIDFSYPFNMSWNPAASVPCGFTSAGLPVGLQIVGQRFDDLGVLQAAAAFEQIQPWAHKRPPL